MKYVGIQTQVWRNNRNSIILLCMFPTLILLMIFVFIVVLDAMGAFGRSHFDTGLHWPLIWDYFLTALPWAVGVVTIWFIIAYFANTAIIRFATRARPLERKENPRVYNIVENLCIAGGMSMPQINIVEDYELNAYASGINESTFTVTLTRGIIDYLDDEELSAVVAHELTHIRNRDTRLMVVSIVFVGILAVLQSIILRMIWVTLLTSDNRRSRKDNGGGAVAAIVVLLVALVIASITYFFSTLTRLAISRKREYMADAGGAELCGNPLALASALRKISYAPGLRSVQRDDVAQLYIVHPDGESEGGFLKSLISKLNSIFSTHPDTEERIKILEQF